MKEKKFNWSICGYSKIRLQPFNLYDTNIYLIKNHTVNIGYVFIIQSKFVLSLCWRVWSFFSDGSGVFYSDFSSLLIHPWFLWSQGQGRQNIAKVEFPVLDPNIFSLGNNTLAKDPDLQRELSRAYFIRAANDWERMEEGCRCSSIPYLLHAR